MCKDLKNNGLLMIFVSFVIVVSLIVGNSFASVEKENSTFWKDRPVKINIQVSLVDEKDKGYFEKLIGEVEKRKSFVTVFVTGEFASKYPAFVRTIEARGHQIAVYGWQKDEDLTILNAEEQYKLIQKSIIAVKKAVSKPKEIVDFKPQGNKFNDDTIKILQDLGISSINGIFSSNESFCKCWYAKKLGQITFPYPITDKFWAVPVSEINKNKRAILDDSFIKSPQDFYTHLIDKYDQLAENGDPLIVALHPSITGSREKNLTVFSQFLTYVERNNGKIKLLSAMKHHTQYTTNLNINSSTNTATVGQKITISGNYTSNLYCPHYRFRVYGKYKDSKEDWKFLKSDCQFVMNGVHPLSWEVEIPMIPEITPIPEKYFYQIRVVGRASFGGCGESENWPTYDSWEVKTDSEVTVNDAKLKLVFVPLNWTDSQAAFDTAVDTQINNFLNEVPIGQCRDQVLITKLDVTTQNFSTFTCSSTDCRVSSIKPFLTGLNLSPENYHVIIGIVQNSPCNPTAGCSNGSDTIWVTPGGDNIVTAHEIGHLSLAGGLEDEYCSNQAGSTDCRCNDGGEVDEDCTPGSPTEDVNPLTAALPSDCPPDGSDDTLFKSPCCNYLFHNCATTVYPGICCRGNKWSAEHDGRCIMSYANAHDPRGFCTQCRPILNAAPSLQCDTPTTQALLLGAPLDKNSFQQIIDINLIVYPDDTVVKQNIDIKDGMPTRTNNRSGNYRLTIVNASDEIQWCQYFNVFYDYAGPIYDEVDYSGINYQSYYMSYRIPYNSNMYAAKLYHGAKLIFSEMLPVSIIMGAVTDSSKNPVANALIQLTGAAQDSTKTNSEGVYKLVGLKPGSYTISVRPDPYDNLMMAFATIVATSGNTIKQDFSLSPAGSIAGMVVDEGGNPVPNVQIYLSGYETPRYSTNENGKYIIPYLGGGSQTVNIYKQGNEPWYIMVNGNYIKQGIDVPVNVILGQTVSVDFYKQPLCGTVNILFPTSNVALEDGVTLIASASNISGSGNLYFYVREPGGASGTPIGQENLTGVFNETLQQWEYNLDTTKLPDGYYVILAKVVDSYGNECWSEPIPISIRNWAVITMLPSTPNSKAGRTMPVKFSLRIAASVDAAQPFVYNEDLEIRIYDAKSPGTILQRSVFGTGSQNYRIDLAGQLYITNFQTSKTPATYVVEIWRPTKNFLVGSFNFSTTK